MEHRRVKKFYAQTNKRNAAPQIAKMQRREAIIHAMASKDPVRTDRGGQEPDVDVTPVMQPDAHHYIADSQRSPSDLLAWVHEKKGHPGVKVRSPCHCACDGTLMNHQEFIPRLKNHILARQTKLPHFGEEYAFTNAELRQVEITPNRIYEHLAIRVNYTTYDMRRAQDYINVRKHANIMVLAHEDDENVARHPYWYARVLGIFHVNVRFDGQSEPKKTEFLWVHWYGQDGDHQGAFETRRLHRVGLMNPGDITSYGILDPSDVLRAIHLIPAFNINTTDQQGSDTNDDETEFYYVSM